MCCYGKPQHQFYQKSKLVLHITRKIPMKFHFIRTLTSGDSVHKHRTAGRINRLTDGSKTIYPRYFVAWGIKTEFTMCPASNRSELVRKVTSRGEMIHPSFIEPCFSVQFDFSILSPRISVQFQSWFEQCFITIYQSTNQILLQNTFSFCQLRKNIGMMLFSIDY